ncbi:hypothetical protein [Streptomyces sp. NEAU-W12]|uniref:hypothetical protein n=1 Tax=Streptomyces sp. NEAU-W12 TaxID=2994668 RepID=UPI00224B9A45|nr:hypothetical protein [Streptomyces sp. NEAU-W12]MCX2923116.1 hypothetical protein [Streptomyces sp. NEAU-W12]
MAEDAGADGYATVLHHRDEAHPAAWTADVPAALTALARTELRAFCLAAAAPGPPDSTAVLCADQALFGLLTLVWRTGADLADGLLAALEHLHALAEPFTHSVRLAAIRPGSCRPGGRRRPKRRRRGT